MITLDHLRLECQKLAAQLNQHKIPLIVVGGYGLLIRDIKARESGTGTLLPVPAARATKDIDALLPLEVMADIVQWSAVRATIDELGYDTKTEHFQFQRRSKGAEASVVVELDLLASPPGDDESAAQFKQDGIRIRPRGANGPKLHARTCEGAYAVEDQLVRVTLGTDDGTVAYVPNAFAFLILKLHALSDRLGNEDYQSGYYHAFDLYRIVAGLSEPEYEQCLRLREDYSGVEEFQETSALCTDLFEQDQSRGMMAIREHCRENKVDIDRKSLSTFRTILTKIFPAV